MKKLQFLSIALLFLSGIFSCRQNNEWEENPFLYNISLLNGKWSVIEYKDLTTGNYTKPDTTGGKERIIFHTLTIPYKFSSFTGVNVIGGDIDYKPYHTMTFKNIWTTLIASPDKVEKTIEFLKSENSVKYLLKEETLYIWYNSNTKLAVLKKE